MSNVQIVIKREDFQDKQTLGSLELYVDGEVVFNCKTLELPWKDNRTNVSCIPEGSYYFVKRHSKKYKNHLHILNVPDRKYILIHNGNYHTQIRGCVLVGSRFSDINRDGYLDVVESKKTLKKLYSIVDKHDDLNKISILAVCTEG